MYNNRRILAVVPARGGSKRLPNKNILSLRNEPLINWTLKAALKSKYIDKLIVSTDSTEIREICLKNGAEVPFLRSDELSTDFSTSFSVINHAIDFFFNEFNIIVMLQPTSPLRITKDIDNSIELLKGEVKSVVSVCKDKHSPLWSNTLPTDLNMANFLRDDIRNKRSQDLPRYYRLNGAIYVAEISEFKTEIGFFGKSTKAYIMPQERSVDIDDEFDFILVKALLKQEQD